LTYRSLQSRRWVRWIALGSGLALVVGIAYVLSSTTTYRRGVNAHIREIRIPLWRKAWHLLDRHWQYQEIISGIVTGRESPEEKVLKIFQWTHERINGHFPEDYPIIDDHVLHIIIRGYGTRDQVADVFTTLLAYADVESRLHLHRNEEGRIVMVFTTVRVGEEWRLFDPHAGVYFRTSRGEIARVEDFITNSKELHAVSLDPLRKGPSSGDYRRVIQRIDLSKGFNRGRDQMPIPRLWYELARWWNGDRAKQ
jgi:hypothetical protein